MAAYLVDTNILVLALRGKNGKREVLQSLVANGSTLACSAVTVGEIYSGMRAHEKEKTKALLNEIHCYPVTTEIAQYAGSLKNDWARRGETFSSADMMIAATAMAHSLILITENRKDFPMAEFQLYPAS